VRRREGEISQGIRKPGCGRRRFPPGQLAPVGQGWHVEINSSALVEEEEGGVRDPSVSTQPAALATAAAAAAAVVVAAVVARGTE